MPDCVIIFISRATTPSTFNWLLSYPYSRTSILAKVPHMPLRFIR